MTTLRFVGQRRRAFTVQGPVTGDPYYVDPGAIGGHVVEMKPEDARVLLENEPGLWERVEKAMLISPEEAALMPKAEVEVIEGVEGEAPSEPEELPPFNPDVERVHTPRGGKGKKE